VVFGPDGTPKRAIGTEGSGPGQFDEPVGIDIAPDGTVYVADVYNARIVLLDRDGQYRSSFPVEGMGTRTAEDKSYLAVLRDGRIAVSMPLLNVVRIYAPDGGLIATIAPTDEPLNRPYGVAETPDGKLWIVEGGAARVRLFALP
jgi:DNA-binding beta-propeller fold protein YncE